MKTTSRIGALLLVALMTSTAVGSVVRAETAAIAAPAQVTQTRMLRLSTEARTALAAAQAARLALFNDNREVARTEIDRGTAALDGAMATLRDVMIPGTDAPDARPEFLPFDSRLGLAETFVATPGTAAALGHARSLFRSDAPDAAIEVLRAASVEVTVSTALLPGEATLQHLRDARSLIDEGRIHEANMALKAVEDSVVVRTFGIDAIPVQGASTADG
ncbi:MAG: YfdX family protein [Rhodobacteraceae bacterium]|jgi:hypothetical protein|nr:YfdX family protein [Paracoccaceae bacterium]